MSVSFDRRNRIEGAARAANPLGGDDPPHPRAPHGGLTVEIVDACSTTVAGGSHDTRARAAAIPTRVARHGRHRHDLAGGETSRHRGAGLPSMFGPEPATV